MLLSSTVREFPGKSPKNSRGSPGTLQKLREPDSLPATRQICLQILALRMVWVLPMVNAKCNSGCTWRRQHRGREPASLLVSATPMSAVAEAESSPASSADADTDSQSSGASACAAEKQLLPCCVRENHPKDPSVLRIVRHSIP